MKRDTFLSIDIAGFGYKAHERLGNASSVGFLFGAGLTFYWWSLLTSDSHGWISKDITEQRMLLSKYECY